MKIQDTTPVLLLTGYLGSGKTTLLNRILSNVHGIRFAVIVNDIGEVNIDASLIQQGGIVGQEGGDDLVALQNGCICCTLQTDLMKQLAELSSSGKFDYIVIEASGICEPAPIAQTVCAFAQMGRSQGMPVMDCIVTVVDALRLRDEFDCGKGLEREDLDEEDIENLIIQQIEFCNIVLINKISEVSAQEGASIRAMVRAIQPKARIICCDYCNVDILKLINTELFDFEDVATSATWVRELEKPYEEEHGHHHHHHDEDEDEDHVCDERCHDGHHHHDHHEHHHHHHHDHEHGEAEEYGIGSFVYFRRRPFDLNKFDYFAGGPDWPRSIIRSKGLVYFASNPDMSYLFESAGRQKELKEAGYWFATAPEEERWEMLARDENLRREWDPEIGDRMIKLVIIGRDMDRDAITRALDACLA